jgi:hypothetical protein
MRNRAFVMRTTLSEVHCFKGTEVPADYLRDCPSSDRPYRGPSEMPTAHKNIPVATNAISNDGNLYRKIHGGLNSPCLGKLL